MLLEPVGLDERVGVGVSRHVLLLSKPGKRERGRGRGPSVADAWISG
jgi:hypothetical protein